MWFKPHICSSLLAWPLSLIAELFIHIVQSREPWAIQVLSLLSYDWPTLRPLQPDAFFALYSAILKAHTDTSGGKLTYLALQWFERCKEGFNEEMLRKIIV